MCVRECVGGCVGVGVGVWVYRGEEQRTTTDAISQELSLPLGPVVQ